MTTIDNAIKLSFPPLPAKHNDFLQYVNNNKDKPLLELLEPYKQYDTELRKAFAQQPDHPAVSIPNILPVFAGHKDSLNIRARDLATESEKTIESYIMPLQPQERKSRGSPAIVDSLVRFKKQFSLFSESALSDMDWSNVVAAGSSVVTSLLPVPEKYQGSKRSMRQFYHEVFAPASDIDLFIYGLSEEQAIDKIRQIEQKVKDALLVETTTVRTKNAITIASQYPTRHIQIVLRIYKSISEILTGFDVDCSCAAFDGKQVWVNPRAVVAYMTQANVVDLTRRSPSYENRLSKYRHRGFEVYWPDLDRSRIDPTIYERSFLRTEGLARLLVLEKLPSSSARDAYLDQRRLERGRPAANRQRRRAYKLVGDIKADHEDELAEWADEEDVSSYHTFTIPYGPKFHAAKIEKLLYTKDLLLNAEWNKPKDREVHLHRHPAFFGSVNDVIHDCCGHCPKPTNMEEEEVHETENRIYVSGDITFIKDDPGRQSIGSFNPLSADDYTEMAYVGNTGMLCRAIVDGDVEYIESWLEQEGNNPDTRDYTGRTPLHLAVMQSTSEVVQLLIDKGARLIARLVDGRTALHLACMRGNLAMVKALLTKSAANEEEENDKIDARREAHRAKALASTFEEDVSESDSDVDIVEEVQTEIDATTENSIINIKSPEIDSTSAALSDDDKDDPDVYDVNIVAWDTAVSPLHLAIIKGHIDIVKCLVQDFGADVLLPAKIFHQHAPGTPKAALLTLVLALQLPQKKAEEMSQTLFELGATCSQADMRNKTAFHVCAVDAPELLEVYEHSDQVGVKRAINHCTSGGSAWNPEVKSALMSAIEARDALTALKLMTLGARSTITRSAYIKAAQPLVENNMHFMLTQLEKQYEVGLEQPVILAVQCELPEVALAMVREHDVNVNTLSKYGGQVLQDEWRRNYTKGTTLLDLVVSKLLELKSWSAEEGDDKAPVPLQSDVHYLDAFEPDTYQRWMAEQQLSKAKQNYRNCWRDHVAKQKKAQQQRGLEEKKAAIFDAMDKYRELEATLRKRGAKGFYELHPNIKVPEERTDKIWAPHGYADFKGIKLEFRSVHSADETQRYAELFDAAWRGDVEAVRSYALMPWTDSEGTQQSSLEISSQDAMGFTPFAIAILRGHYELADIILQLAKAQYSPTVEDRDRRRVRLRGQGDDGNDHTDSEDDNSESDIPLETEIIGDKFTVDNVGEVAASARSTHQPSAMLKWGWGVNDCTFFNPKNVKCSSTQKDEDECEQSNRSLLQRPQNLIQWAIWQGDTKALGFLLDAGTRYRPTNTEQGTEDPVPFSVSRDDFLYAISANDPQCVSILIKSTCAGVPLQQFIKKSGTELDEKPKYYQGLSVRGVKKKEWAMRGHQQQTYEPYEHIRPPIHEAAYRGSLELVEWFQSDAPLRCYKYYAATHPEDKRVQQLERIEGGFEKLVKYFLGIRTELTLHCAIMSGRGKAVESQSGGSIDLVEHLIKMMPDSINTKSEQGLTPLHIAFALCHEQDARLLIEAGADQTARDKNGRNIIHMLLSRTSWSNTSKSHRVALQKMLGLIDKRLLESLFEERSAAGDHTRTPFALWLSQVCTLDHEGLTGQMLLDASKGVELDFIDGQGQTPLHTAVDRSNLSVCKLIIKHNPQLIHRENATGRTPYAQVEDKVLAHYFTHATDRAAWEPFRSINRIPPRRDDLTTRAPEHFLRRNVAEMSLLESIWQLMQETKAQLEASGRAKRILVTLNEANEVARRLSATHAQQQHVPSESADKGVAYHSSDEVAIWFAKAMPSYNRASKDD
ncbi:hypothetical protein AMS68_006533 [Peltaster fructicola]|uniref:Ankyrin repeat protein n=1 Tax=Peltaster fructicola TaxID=286661 RepID=A0A6H0Y245_9PEZI|nr:hypothetical protein AMS68_006533 [Peltaster fructicola]